MSLRNYGTNRPIDTGGLLRRGVVLLAALLLVCTLMAGAVSAEAVTGNGTESDPFVVSDYSVLKEKLESGNYVKLNQNMEGTENILIRNGNSSVLDLNGCTLTTTKQISIGNDSASVWGKLVVKDSENGGKITTTASNPLFWVGNKSSLILEQGTFEANQNFAITGNANGEYANPTVEVKSGVTITSNDTAIYLPAEGSKATFIGAEITGTYGGICIASGEFVIQDTSITANGGTASDRMKKTQDGSLDDGSAISLHKKRSGYVGPLTLKLSGKTFLNVTDKTQGAGALSNFVFSDDQDADKVKVIISDSVTFEGAIQSRNYADQSATAFGGIFQDESGNLLLYPGLNQTGVTWTGNAESGYTLAISADGSYKLMADVTTTETIAVDKAVTLDLNGHTIEAKKKDKPAMPVNLLTVNDPSAKLTLKGTGLLDGRNCINVTKGSAVIMSGVTLNATNVDILLFGQESSATTTNTVEIQDGAKLTGASGVGIYGNNYAAEATRANAYGVDLMVNGKITTNDYGVFTNGYIKNSNAKITIGPKAEITSGVGLYGPGQTEWIINDGAVVTGNEALSIKGGDWTLLGGTFTANGEMKDPSDPNNDGAETSGAAVSISNTYQNLITVTIQGGTFRSTNGYALFDAVHTKTSTDATKATVLPAYSLLKKLTILGGMFESASGQDVIKLNQTTVQNKATNLSITGGKYNKQLNASYLSSPFIVVQDGGLWTVAKEVPRAQATVTKDETGTVTVNAGSSDTIVAPTQAEGDGSVILKLKAGDTTTEDVITLIPASGQELTVSDGVVTGQIAAAVIKPAEIEHPEGQTTKLELSTTNLEELFKGDYKLEITNEPKASDMGGTTPENIVAGISVTLNGIELSSAKIQFTGIHAGSKTPQVWHAKNSVHSRVASTYSGGTVTATASEFSSYYVTLTAAAVSSGSGNMNNAFRVLFETQGGSYVSPATGLSYGDRVAEPANPVKDGYTFGGWYKDAACTQAWSFSDSIPGDMTLYAKWTSSGTAATATQTAQTTTKATTAPASTQAQSGTTATTAAPVATTAAGAQPTLTQAPAPVLGGLFGLLIAGVLLRRRE